MTNINNEGRFMVAVGAIVQNTTTNKILLVQRSDKADFEPGTWEFITGRMKQFEEPQDALKREIKEEVNLDVEVIKPFTIFHIFRAEKVAEKEIIGIVYWCKTDSEDVTLSPEHQDYKWVTASEALEIIKHPGVKEDIKTFIKECITN